MTIFNIDLVSTDLGAGIVGLDAYQGTGFIMYSQTDVRERFNIRSDQASAFVSVTYDSAADQWYYLANSALVAFEPEPYDHLIATVDFKNDTVSILHGAQDPIAGVSAGIIEGDIAILPNMWNGSPNAGEFMVTGTHMTIYFATQRVDLTADDLGKGIVGMDWLKGQGYIMYSDVDVRSRFDIRADQAGAFVSVAYNADMDQWFYVGNSEFVAFDPLETDVLIAQVDFGTDQIDMLIRDDAADPIYLHGIQAGVYDTDIWIAANRWNGSKNNGEFQVYGTYLELAPMVKPTVYELDANSHSIAATDNRTGDGFILYSPENLQDRFDALNGYTDDHFVAVVYQNGVWYYDNNTQLVEFTPNDGDVLVAAVDFGANTVQDLQGYGSSYHGISLGYQSGNLQFHAERWFGSKNAGEFEVTGNWLTPSNDSFVFKSADTLASRTTLPDGALGSTDGKGWTCTGLFYDNGTFWSGNDGRRNHYDKTHDPSVIRMDMDGSTILEQIDVHALEQNAGVSWNIRTIQGVIVDNNGDLWVASSTSHVIFKVVATETETGETHYALDPSKLIQHKGANGLAFNADTNELMTYSVSTGRVTVFDISDGSATATRSFAIGKGGDQLFYQAETGHLFASFGGNGQSGFMRVFDAETGQRIGQTNLFEEVTAVEGIAIVDNQLFIQSDAYFHPEGPVDLNQLIVYDLDPFVNGTEWQDTTTLSDYWF